MTEAAGEGGRGGSANPLNVLATYLRHDGRIRHPCLLPEQAERPEETEAESSRVRPDHSIL